MTFNITIVDLEGSEYKIKGDSDTYILDSLEDFGYSIPNLCRAGACGRCASKILEGQVDNSEQSYLTEDQIQNGYSQICVAYPLSDCKILVGQEEFI